MQLSHFCPPSFPEVHLRLAYSNQLVWHQATPMAIPHLGDSEILVLFLLLLIKSAAIFKAAIATCLLFDLD
jgi:hypothetical protein